MGNGNRLSHRVLLFLQALFIGSVHCDEICLLQRRAVLRPANLSIANDTVFESGQRFLVDVSDSHHVVISLGVPLLLAIISVLGILFERFALGDEDDGIFGLKHAVVMLITIGIAVASDVAHGEIVQLEPRITSAHPWFMATVENASMLLLLPLGLYLHGMNQAMHITGSVPGRDYDFNVLIFQYHMLFCF